MIMAFTNIEKHFFSENREGQQWLSEGCFGWATTKRRSPPEKILELN